MITRFLKRTALLGGVLLVSMSIGGRSVLAAPPGPGPPGGRLNITEVFVDAPADGQITIMGENFLFGGTPDVTLGDFGSLTIVAAPTDNQIVANLPAAIPAGDYLLTVSTGTGQTENDEYDLTIAAVASYALLTHDLAAGTDGGSHLGGMWITRSLNTKVYDPDAIVTLASNQFTLGPGDYLIQANQTIFGGINIQKGFRGRIRNVTDATTVAVALLVRIHIASGESVALTSPIPPTLVSLSGAKTFELQFFVQNPDGLSVALGLANDGTVHGEVERYASVHIQKIR